MINNDYDHIPEDRNDSECPHCGGGRLTNPRLIRKWANLEQYIWKCIDCEKEVVMIDQIENQTCPTCGTENVLTLDQLLDLLTDKNKK
jgi:DNA-directed RNA polymerase subunit RPC12/RpoP